MVEIIIGCILILAAIGYSVYTYKVNNQKMFEMKYMQRSTINDAIDIVNNMYDVDPNYHHYVELQGNIQSTEDVLAPFSNRKVAYYENRCLSVTQQTHSGCDREGHYYTYTTKQENEISHEKSSTQVYITDQSCNEKIFVDVASFLKNVELMPACNRFEQKGSPWLNNNINRFNFSPSFGAGSHFLGYKFEENILLPHQPLYILGELYKLGEDFYISRATATNKKPSLLSYKSQDEIISDTKQKRLMTLFLCFGAMVIGAIFIVVGLNT